MIAGASFSDGTRFASQGEGDLVMEVRFLDAMTNPAATATEWPEFIVQLSDGGGGWIMGDGPLPAEDDPEHRGAMVFRGWPRTANPLVFRALRPNCPPVEFQRHQPKPLGPPAAWSAASVPQVHKETDFTLTLEEAREEALPNFGHYIGLIHEFTPRFTDNKREGFRGAKIECEWKNAAGRTRANPLLGGRADLFPVVFLNGATESSGDGEFNSSGQHSAMTSGEFEFEGDWFGHLKPGQKLRIGLATQLPPTDVFFIFDRSAITK